MSSSLDVQWANFKVWKDLNADGYSDPDNLATTGINEREIFTLAELGITSINLTRDEQSFELPGGSQVYGLSTFTRTNGRFRLRTCGTTGVAGQRATCFFSISMG